MGDQLVQLLGNKVAAAADDDDDDDDDDNWMAFASEDWRQSWKSSVRVPGFKAKIWPHDSPNMKQQHNPFVCNIQC